MYIVKLATALRRKNKAVHAFTCKVDALDVKMIMKLEVVVATCGKMPMASMIGPDI
jgi:hypothetical protein